MDEKATKRKLYQMAAGLSLSLAVCILALAVMMSRAWFAENKNVSANGMQVNVQTSEDIAVTVEFYAAEKVDGDVITFSGTAKTTDATTLPQYDPMEATTRYILMKLTADAPCTLTISTTTDYVLDNTRPLLGETGRGENYSNWLSSILFFEEVTLTNNQATLIGTDRFTFVDKTDYTFKNSTASPATSSHAINGDPGQTTPTYIIIGYDVDLLNHLFSQNIGNDVVNSTVYYVNDCNFTVTAGGEVAS